MVYSDSGGPSLFDRETGCITPLLATRDLRVSLFYPGLTSFLIGLFKILAMVFFFLNNVRNRWILSRIDRIMHSSEYNTISKTLILPTYYPLIYVLIVTDLMFGIADITMFYYADRFMEPSKPFFWIFPIQLAIYHAISEGIAIFYTKSGAGYRSMLEAAKFAFCWFIFNVFFLFITISLPSGYIYKSPVNLQTMSYTLLFIYNVTILAFYIYLSYSPNMTLLYKIFGDSNSLNRRPSLIVYAKFNIYFNLYWIIFGSFQFFINENQLPQVTCVSHYLGIILMGLFQSYNVWSSLVKDSQYWQGFFDSNNPLKELIVDLVNLNTAATISEQLSHYETDKRELPLLHFGLITINQNMNFVAGGVSRVYFGQFKEKNIQKDVAIKLMYLMEFNSSDVKDFFDEAVILHTLKSPRIVECYGICVMPPAITMVLEFCKYGSLFDFLHKNSADKLGESSALMSFIKNLGNMSFAVQNRSTTGQSSTNSLTSTGTDNVLNPMNEGVTRKSMTKFDIETTNSNKGESSSTHRISGGDRITGAKNEEICINSSGKIDDLFLYVMAVDAAEAIEHLHSMNFMHCDIKSLNFLVGEGYRLKLADMGEARYCNAVPKRDRPPIAALNWVPPEVLEEDSNALTYTQRSDIFGLAIIINEILTREVPFGTKCNSATYQGWLNTLTKDNIRPTFPDNMPPQLKDILIKGWHSDPLQRCSSKEIKDALISQSVSDFYSTLNGSDEVYSSI